MFDKTTLHVTDLFCGGGGTSEGLKRAAARTGHRVKLTAVNHWDRAIETHSANHPDAEHLCHDIDSIDPRTATGGRCDILLASPECTHHSVALGGKPINDQSRSTAMHVVRFAEALRPRAIVVENVAEFRSWGPLGSNGRPLKSKRGAIFESWLGMLRAIGYHVEHRVLNAADYGAATSRRRLFVVAVRGRGPVPWPEPTHAERSESVGLFGGRLKPWRGAREIIDWNLPGRSIFTRKRPLSDKTLQLIAAGLVKFGGKAAAPFLLMLTHGGRLHSIDNPVPTITTANRGELALAEPVPSPFLISAGGPRGQARNPHSLEEPIGTIITDDHRAMVQPYLLKYYGNESTAHSIGEPLGTITTKDRFSLVQPRPHLDILLRMLQPHELAAAMSFPKDYKFHGNRGEVVKQIGNAVDVCQADALISALLAA